MDLFASGRNKVANAAKAGSPVVNQHVWDCVVGAANDKVYIGELPAYHELLPELSSLIFAGAGAMTLDACVEADAAGGFGVASAAVTAGGSGYTSAPTVTFADPPNGGVRAKGTASITTGAVTGITITDPGSGYLTAPAISFSGGGGTGASATATLGENAIFDNSANPAGAAFTRVACTKYQLAKALGVAQVNRSIYLKLDTATVAGGQVIAQIASAPIA